MKSAKAFCSAAIVALALSVPAYAGEISSPGAPSPGGSGTSDTTPPPPGDISSPAIAGDVGFPPAVVDILLALASIF